MAVVAACIAYVQLTVTQYGITGIYAVLQYYVADFTCSCDYFAVFIYGEVVVCCVECAGAAYKERHNSVFCHSTYGQVVFGVQCIGLDGVYINVFVQLNLNLSAVMAYADVLVTSEVNIIAGFYVGCFGSKTVGGQVPAFICICSYLFDFFQLAYIYSISIINACSYVSDYFIVSIQAIFGNVSRATKANAHIIIHEEVTSMNAVNIKVSVQVNLNKGSILVFFLAYGNIFIVAAEVNITAGFYVGCFGCKTVGRQIPTLVGSFFYSVQLAYVYSVSIGSTCCYIDNLTFSTFTAYGYCISSVSYTAGTQSNSAFCTYASTAADSNCIIGCNFILMTEGNNIAYASDYVFVAHYNGIGNIVQSIMGACHEYVMATLFLITDKLVVIADNGRISLFGNGVGTADYCNGTALLFSENRIVTAKNS